MAVDDSNTKALLHMDGADASTTFTDESGKTWTPAGSAQIDQGFQKFGTGSGMFNGSSDYLTTPDSTDFDLGEVWTIDFWVRFNSRTGNQCFLHQYEGGLRFYTFRIDATNNNLRMRFYYGAEYGQWVTSTNPTINTNTWYHIAYVRNGASRYIFLDGVSQALTTVNAHVGNITLAGQANLARNQDLGGEYINGWIDEFRLSKGIARWTANFTPPTSAYGIVPSTGAFFQFL